MKKKLMSLVLVAAMSLSLAACGGGNGGGEVVDADVPSIDKINGDDYKDLKADIKVLTDRTDLVDTTYKGYAEEFHKIYPNINVTYEAVTDYAESITLRLTNGDWGDVCFIPATVEKSELSTYFTPMGNFDELDPIYNNVVEKSYDGVVYGIPNGANATGIAYNKKVWEDAGITELPKTPDEFLDDLQTIKDKTDAIPLYTNFSDGWPLGELNDSVGISSNVDPDYKKNKMLHEKDPFTKRDDMTGPYAVYYVLYEAVARGLVEEDPASSDWESSKRMINNGEIASMPLKSWCVIQFAQAGDHPEDVGYMPFPISVNGKQATASGGNYAYGINNKSSEDNQIASMLFVKWMLEESTIFEDEGNIPARKDKGYPEWLSGFDGVEFLSDNPSPEGEETLYDDLCNMSELLNNNHCVTEVVEAALYGTKTLDELMDEWNQKWTEAQESYSVEVTE